MPQCDRQTYNLSYTLTEQLVLRIARKFFARYSHLRHLQDVLVQDTMSYHEKHLRKWDPEQSSWTSWIGLKADSVFRLRSPKYSEGPSTHACRVRSSDVLGASGSVAEIATTLNVSKRQVREHLDYQQFQITSSKGKTKPDDTYERVQFAERLDIASLPVGELAKLRYYARKAKMPVRDYLVERARNTPIHRR